MKDESTGEIDMAKALELAREFTCELVESIEAEEEVDKGVGRRGSKSADFSEQEHPRDEGGKFAESAQAPSVKPSEIDKPKTQEEARDKIQKAVENIGNGNYSIWEMKWANGTVQIQVNHKTTKRSMGIMEISSEGEIKLNDTAKQNFPTLLPEEKPEDVAESSDNGNVTKLENGHWKTTAAGQKVAMVPAEDVGIKITHSHKIRNTGIVKEGDRLVLDGEEFVLEAIGHPFKVGKEQFVYLYPNKPQKLSQRHRDEIPDDPLERMQREQEQAAAKIDDMG